jgi:hypothetical protein
VAEDPYRESSVKAPVRGRGLCIVQRWRFKLCGVAQHRLKFP